MWKIVERTKSFFKERKGEGATIVEYGIMVALIALALIWYAKELQSGIQESLTEAGTEIKAAIP